MAEARLLLRLPNMLGGRRAQAALVGVLGIACAFADGPGDEPGADAAARPGDACTAETCNGRDDDCDGQADDAVPVWYRDGDGDGWGDPANTWARCDRPDGYVARGGDCDDRDLARFAGSGCPR